MELGPAMAALTEKQRKFVLAMVAEPFASRAKWARMAGYSDASEAAKVTAHYLMHNPKIEAATLEVSQGLLSTVGPVVAAAGLLRIAQNPRHKHHGRALEALANRVGLPEVKELRVKKVGESAEEKFERIKRLAALLGIDPAGLIGANVVAFPVKQIEGKISEETEQ